MLLIHAGDAGELRHADFAAVWVQFAQDQLKQGRFADAIAADQSDLGIGRDQDGGMVEKAASPCVEHEVIDLQHGCFSVRGGVSRYVAAAAHNCEAEWIWRPALSILRPSHRRL